MQKYMHLSLQLTIQSSCMFRQISKSLVSRNTEYSVIYIGLDTLVLLPIIGHARFTYLRIHCTYNELALDIGQAAACLRT